MSALLTNLLAVDFLLLEMFHRVTHPVALRATLSLSDREENGNV